ncbi:MAG: hypothetical protein FJ297_10075 [Planctomycetes bacterium]|nr:hypothetical protein [Planctomycetota bacterium]
MIARIDMSPATTSASVRVATNRRSPHAVVVGDHRASEFAAALRWLEDRVVVTRLDSLDASNAYQAALEGRPVDLLVLAQSRPGQVDADALARLHRAFPLARVVGLLGSWCEGETRSGTPWPGVPRLAWHQFVTRLEREWLAPSGPLATWSLPRTATNADRLAASRATHRPIGSRGLAVVRASQFAVYEGLDASLRSDGWSTVWWAPHSPLQRVRADALVWDLATIGNGELDAFRMARRMLDDAPAIVIAGFPRLDDHQAFSEAGAASVIAKPYELDDLLASLARLTPRSDAVRESAASPRLSRRTA